MEYQILEENNNGLVHIQNRIDEYTNLGWTLFSFLCPVYYHGEGNLKFGYVAVMQRTLEQKELC